SGATPSSPMVSTITERSAPTATSSSSSERWRKLIGLIDRRPIRREKAQCAWRPQNESSRADRNGAEPRQVHRVPYLLGHLQKCLDQPRGHGIRLVQQCRDKARHWISQGLGESGAVERRLAAQAQRPPCAQNRRQMAGPGKNL